MNQNTFCKYCHRIPSQCSCVPAKTLTDEEIRKVADEVFKDYKNWHHYQIDFARAILKKASDK